ncbi:TlpA disulfide reductase family protein, partial [Campylobacter concisus]|uniref:TlpA disulfide reductase family protein n=1 Tax=Campylobacter concisus TaxID=199 RepID=UPI002156260A
SKNLEENASKDENLRKDTLTAKKSESGQSDEVEEIRLSLLNGKTMQITKRSNGFDVKDGKKATLYVFFATWCPPSKAEIPSLNNLSEKFKNELNIVAVLLEDKSEDEVKEFAQK